MFLGLDISSTSTGVALVEGLEVFRTYTLKIESKDSIERAVCQHRELDEILRGTNAPVINPKFAIIESYAFRARGRYKHMLYEAGTMLRYTLYNMQIPWMTINPSQLKKFATGSGRADKDAMIEAVTRLTDYVPENDDVADAIWLALAGQAIDCIGFKTPTPWLLDDVQLELVTKWIPDFVKEVVDEQFNIP
jgi:crossover junction endodeoxyribonuclease RuvC